MEQRILDAVAVHLSTSSRAIWEDQISAINKAQRYPDGAGVNFYMRDSDVIPRFADHDEFVIATVNITIPTFDMYMESKVWCVSGRLFSIEHKGNINYYEEAVGMDPAPEIVVEATQVYRGLK